MSDFVHLHLHTEHSLLDGINRVDTLPDHIAKIGQSSVAITDHGTVSGSYQFYKSCIGKKIKPIIGMEAYYTHKSRHLKEKDEDGSSYYHLVLLAQNNQGLHNLFKLSSFAYTEGMYSKPRIDDELLGQLSEGVMATSACLGSRASQLILKGRKEEARRILEHHAAIFKDRFFVEIQLHEGEQQIVNQALIEMADQLKLPIVVTADCHYSEQEDKRLHEIALCMQTQDKLSNPNRFSFGDIDVHVASFPYLLNLSKKLGLSESFLRNTSWVASMVDSSSYFEDKKNNYPTFKGLPPGLTSWDALEKVAKGELTKKFGGLPPIEYRERLNHELMIIKKMGFYDYLLIVWQFLNGAREQGVWVGPGRGSAAGSLVSYALGITQIDPIKYGLLFER